MGDIFISYSRHDKAFASRLANDLAREGWDVYYDLKLKPSQNYEVELARKAAAAKYLLVVLSPNSLASKWVHGEVKAALQREREGSTTVVPLLVAESDPERITELVGPKYYADFTNDYDGGFKAILSALDDSAKGSDERVAENGSGAKKAMRVKEPAIAVAIITGIVTLVTAYWQFGPARKDPPGTIQYAGRVMDARTQKAIHGAKVSVESQGVPQIYYSDSEGIFYLQLPSSSQLARIRIEAGGYDTFDRNVSVSRTGIEDVRLTPSPVSSPTANNPETNTGQKKASKENEQRRIDEILKSQPSNTPK